jgi:hypothetical protein
MSTALTSIINSFKVEKEKIQTREHDKSSDRGDRDKEREKLNSPSIREHKFNVASPNSRPTSRDIQSNSSVNEGGKPWNYPAGLDIMASGAFWQNYSGNFLYIIFFNLNSKFY